jgi:hypothetical protein
VKTKAKIFLVLALLVSGVALAKYVGRFYCSTGCEVGTGYARGSTHEFIFTVINQTVDSWVDSQGRPNQVIICNGTKCSLYTYIKASGMFIAEGYYYSSWTGGGSGGGSGGAGGIVYTNPGSPGCIYGCGDLWGTVGPIQPVPPTDEH